MSSFKYYKASNDKYIFGLNKNGYCLTFDIPFQKGKKFEIWDETYWQAQRTDWLTENLTQQMPESLSSLSL